MRIADGRPDLSPVPLAELAGQAYTLASDLVAPLPDDHHDGLALLDGLWELQQRSVPSAEPQPRRSASPFDEWIKTSATPVLALVGGWLGARLALGRSKAERTYERRIEWHLSALRTIQRLKRATESVHYDAAPCPASYWQARKRSTRWWTSASRS